ncbi:acetyltransferase [Thiococcus pfennigii]|jgi:hypothetical protein|uniref:acetyltransferase n=1 Tax=Thiococcus pfennigii TaxID=1057 RepID=UPI0019083955|nr:acetyltransferase [Thiococcus pfennigii]MBK1699444.1 acetyltransferase [Thiococcus pfennigii]MBK1732908.1 acetyltransferase [Thiococcus pfennigii]
MTHYDVFNGDADGLCALHQLRLVEAIDSVLVTGVKRDIALLERVPVESASSVTVLDVSLDKNRGPLLELLARDVPVTYFDHHYAGEIPSHPALSVHIDPAPDRCTSLLVDEALRGRCRPWAVVGAFGDGMEAAARSAAAPLGLAEADLMRLRELGICLNYNGYGERVADLHFAPDALYRRMQAFGDPFAFMAEDDAFATLSAGFADDMARARELAPRLEDERHGLYVLPAEAWARRISGVLANEVAHGAPERAHALLTERPDGGFVVSVRAPRATGEGADALCRQFPTGGGRKGAAGINVLAEADYDLFVERFLAAF